MAGRSGDCAQSFDLLTMCVKVADRAHTHPLTITRLKDSSVGASLKSMGVAEIPKPSE